MSAGVGHAGPGALWGDNSPPAQMATFFPLHIEGESPADLPEVATRSARVTVDRSMGSLIPSINSWRDLKKPISPNKRTSV